MALLGGEHVRVVAMGEGGRDVRDAFSAAIGRGVASESHMIPWRLPAMKNEREKRDDEAKKLETTRLESASAGVRGRSRTEEEDPTEQEMKDLGGG